MNVFCFFQKTRHTHQKGFSLVELIVGSALFAMIAVGVYQAYASLTMLISASRVKVTATDLLNEQFELIRNLPYDKVGIAGGLPVGVLNHIDTYPRDNGTFTITRTIRSIDDPFDGMIGSSPNDLSPADYKLVELEVSCAGCKNFAPISVTTRVSPKNLETASSNGALFVRVFDANGQPVQNADVHIVNSKATTTITIDDVTDNQGMLQIVDAPPGNTAYHIVVSKTGYTSDQTYATSTGNPHPTKPDATVVLQQVTQVSFVIDRVSTIQVSTMTSSCVPVPNVPFTIVGTKLIGTLPDVPKFSQNLTTNGSGEKTISNIDWDTYAMTIGSGSYHLAGVNPLLPFAVLPNAIQNVQLIVTNEDPAHLLVTVKDTATQLPLSGATVTLSSGSFNRSLVTGRGFLSQTDWSGGSGQSTMVDQTRYASSDGNIATGNPAGEFKLSNIFGVYASSGEIISSTFDTGTTSNFSQISWSPVGQPVQTGASPVRFQFATASTSDSGGSWNFLGPDGTNGTYYSSSNTNISSVHSGDRYFRYKGYLQTASTTYSPNVADVAVTVTSACTPPGQVLFTDLSGGTYTLTVDLSGYTQWQGQITIPNDASYLQQEVLLNPS